MSGYEISILKFSWAMKSQLHAFILQKEVWSESEISLNWTELSQLICCQQITIETWLSISWYMLEKCQ